MIFVEGSDIVQGGTEEMIKVWWRSEFFCVFWIIIVDRLLLEDGSCDESFVVTRWQHCSWRKFEISDGL